jgi:beta-galactosidase
MYPEIDAIVAWAESDEPPDMPLIMCEYAHAMGNSSGCLAEYWDAIEAHDGLQGGFVWEWWDHGLVQQLADGSERYAYGGDFGDVPNDANFCCDGLVWPDRRPKPQLEEHKYLACPVDVVFVRGGRVKLTNRQWFSDLAWLRATWEVAVDGEAVSNGRLTLPRLAPGASTVVALPRFAPPALRPGQEAFLTIRFFTSHELPWAPEGFEVGWRQVSIGARAASTSSGSRSRGPAVELERDGDEVRVRADVMEALVHAHAGVLLSLRHDGHEFLHDGPMLSLWRAPTDNDGIKALGGQELKPYGLWRAWGLDDLQRTCTGTTARRRDGAVVVTANHELRGSARGADTVITHRSVITFMPDGSLRFDEDVRIPPRYTDLPRVGVVLALAPGFEGLEWYGRGPHENYPDRNRGAAIGRYRSMVADEYVPYIVPQEHGGHTDTRWFSLAHSTTGIDARFDALEPFQFSASHFTAGDLTVATHDVELMPRAETIVHLDAAHRGLGTLSCGPDTLPQYRPGPGRYRWTWQLSVQSLGA